MPYKALIRSVTTYACPTWKYAADTHLLKLQRLQNIDRCRAVSELHVDFKIPYMYAYVTKSCSIQAEVILNHVKPIVRGTGKGETRHRKYKRFKLGGGQACDRSAT
jgi:hypothetical protein